VPEEELRQARERRRRIGVTDGSKHQFLEELLRDNPNKAARLKAIEYTARTKARTVDGATRRSTAPCLLLPFIG
jgi:hypothetical protein